MAGLAGKLQKAVALLFTNPMLCISVGRAIVRGSWYIFRYSFFNKRVRIGFPFRAYAPVVIIGQGCVEIGKGCSVYWNAFDSLTIVTLAKDASVRIGSGCGLAGLTIRCAGKVEIGNECLFAYSLVQDTIIVNTPCSTGEITIGNNLWLGGQSCVFGGSSIGNDCVLTIGTLTKNINAGDYRLVSGSPAKKSLPIDQVLKLTSAL